MRNSRTKSAKKTAKCRILQVDGDGAPSLPFLHYREKASGYPPLHRLNPLLRLLLNCFLNPSLPLPELWRRFQNFQFH